MTEVLVKPLSMETDVLPCHTILGSLQRLKALRGLSHPAAYAFGATLLTVLSAGTAFVAPMLLGPEAFGTFALLTTFFQLATRGDLGLSQLADRDLALGLTDGQRGSDILLARWILGGFFAVLAVPILVYLSSGFAGLKPLDMTVTLLGGLAAMIAAGPVSLFRASSRLWEFTATALLLQLGMTLPRLLGLAFGGTTGCYVVLLGWYGFFALAIGRPRVGGVGMTAKALLAMIGVALPLFCFSTAWMIYLFASRWIASILMDEWSFGLFAFGANLSFIVVGTVSTISQAYYPKLIAGIGSVPRGAFAWPILRQIVVLITALSVPLAVAMPVLPFLMTVLFARFVPAISVTMVLAVAAIPLCVASWLMPMAIALSKNPLREAALFMVPAIAALVGGMVVGDLWFGMMGQAVGTLVAAVIAVSLLAVILTLQSALRIAMAAALILATIAVCLFLGLEAALLQARLSDGGAVLEPSIHNSDREIGEEPKVHSDRLMFADEFDGLRLAGSVPEGGWEPYYPWGARSNPTNRELQYYVDPRRGGERGSLTNRSPFRVEKGVLSIIAQPSPPEMALRRSGYPYLSGMLTSEKAFSFTYGYIEVRARLPKGKGLWPAVWLLPLDAKWPPELDVLEAVGNDTAHYFGSVHYHRWGLNLQKINTIATPDGSLAFNVYGLRWAPTMLEWYFNGQKMASMPTPLDLNQPMYLLINLAVGGNWAGPPDQSTPFPARFDLDYVRVYAL